MAEDFLSKSSESNAVVSGPHAPMATSTASSAADSSAAAAAIGSASAVSTSRARAHTHLEASATTSRICAKAPSNVVSVARPLRQPTPCTPVATATQANAPWMTGVRWTRRITALRSAEVRPSRRSRSLPTAASPVSPCGNGTNVSGAPACASHATRAGKGNAMSRALRGGRGARVSASVGLCTPQPATGSKPWSSMAAARSSSPRVTSSNSAGPSQGQPSGFHTWTAPADEEAGGDSGRSSCPPPAPPACSPPLSADSSSSSSSSSSSGAATVLPMHIPSCCLEEENKQNTILAVFPS
mmetsp:Transcript_100371/g.283111  ORF Transcript_100371/g.283111 Transcript_100371/m.283111 type:complete len:299 (+) Transcript_100371:1216-2112(+)